MSLGNLGAIKNEVDGLTSTGHPPAGGFDVPANFNQGTAMFADAVRDVLARADFDSNLNARCRLIKGVASGSVLVENNACNLIGVVLDNTGASRKYVQFYNLNAPVVGTTLELLDLTVPGNSQQAYVLVQPVAFSLALSLAVTDSPHGGQGGFAVLAATTITNTGATVINGDLGLSPGSSVTGFPPGVVTGTQHVANAQAAAGKVAAEALFTDLGTRPTTQDLSGQDLGGKTLGPGVYNFSSSAALTGTLNLVGQGEWVFKIGSTLTLASAAQVLVNGLPNTNGQKIYWRIGSSGTFGTTSKIVGTVIARTSNTMNTGATAVGSMTSLDGALTLDTNTVTFDGGAGGDVVKALLVYSE